MRSYSVGVVGATGLVGQRLLSLLEGHPWFRAQVLAASDRSRGRAYADAVRWSLAGDPPETIAAMELAPCEPEAFEGCQVVFSALEADVARAVEPRLVEAGLTVVSNSSAFRQRTDVPLLIPEINAAHLALLGPPAARGRLVTNPNCCATGIALAAAPLDRAFGVRRMTVTMLQAVSGAGLGGPRAMELIDNVLPHIPGEEEKIEIELNKMLGRVVEGRVQPAELVVSASCHRVAGLDGHLAAVSVELDRPAGADDVAAELGDFRGDVADLGLPSSPARPVVVRTEPDRPQPRRDRDAGGGMSAVVGRIRPCPVLGVKFSLLSHNTVRGAAGGALLNAELLAARGFLDGSSDA
jgi:aspartate-semialdehyde dehydrogenase